jgi:hypothetical protein
MRSRVAPASLLVLGLVTLAEAQVGTWALTGRVVATACIAGRCVRERGPDVSGLVVIAEDGTYTSPNAGGSCVGEAPDEVGTWVLDGKKVLFETENVDEIVAALETCFDGVTIDVRRYSNKAKLKRGGTLLRGKAKLTGRIHVQGRTASVAAVSRWKGTPVEGVAAGASALPSAMLPAVVRCAMEGP